MGSLTLSDLKKFSENLIINYRTFKIHIIESIALKKRKSTSLALILNEMMY